MLRSAPLFLAGLALLAAGCSQDERLPATCDEAYRDPSGGCGRGAVEGTIELAAGGPEARTTVTLVGEGTDSIGDSGEGARTFSIGRVPAGRYSLVAHAPGYVSRSVESVRIKAGETMDVGTLVLEVENRAPAIVGTVLLRGATDHRGTLVSLDDSTMVTGTAEDGSFRIDAVEPGSHVLRVRHPGYDPIDTGVVVQEVGELQVHLEMAPVSAPGTLAGEVVEAATGAPLQGATIRVGETRGGASTADGSYTIDVPAGTYQVRVGYPGFEPLTFDAVVIRPGETTQLNVELERVFVPASLRGVARRMHSAHGTDAGIVVSVLGSEASAVTEADGSWSIAEIEPGLYDIEFVDEFMPSITVPAVAVTAEEKVSVPEVVLGPARKIAGGTSSASRVFPANRKALVTLAGDSATYLFDGSSGELARVADEALEVIAVDVDERYATLLGAGSLHRLEIETGLVEVVSAPAFGSLLSDRALTIFVGEDGLLYLLRAGDLEPEPREPLGSAASLSHWEAIDADRGWEMVRVSSSAGGGFLPVDFTGWLGPWGPTVYSGESPGTMGILGPGSIDSGRNLYWIEMETRTAKTVSTATQWGLSSGRGRMLFFHDLVGGTTSVSALDMRTGDVTPLESGIADDFWSNLGSIVAKRGDEMVWVSSNPPASGVLCGAPYTEVFRSPIYGCTEGTGAKTLRVFFHEVAGGAMTFSTNASNPSITSWGLVTWTEPPTPSLIFVRPVWAEAGRAITCPGATFSLLSNRSTVLANCSNGSSYLLDFVEDRTYGLPSGTVFCSHDPERELAVCSRACNGESCLYLYDTSTGSTAPVTSSPSAAITTTWGGDRSVAIRTGTGAAFHVKAGAPGVPPQVTDCGLESVRSAGVEADYSLWFDPDAWVGTICSSDGTLSVPFALWSTGANQVGDSKKRFIGGWLVDLEDGTRAQLLAKPSTVLPIAGGLLVSSDDGLLRISENGDVDSIVAGAQVIRRADLAGRPAFSVIRGSSFDLLVVAPDGTFRTLVEDVSDVRYFEDRVLYFHDSDGASAAVTAVDSVRAAAWPIPLRIVPADRWLLDGDRLFFDTPTDAGTAFATADLASGTATLLHEGSGGHAIGSDGSGRWLFVADGWTWQETADSPRAAIAGETSRLVSGAGGVTVFQAVGLSALYWLDSE